MNLLISGIEMDVRALAHITPFQRLQAREAMSDMLPLVVEICNIQAAVNTVTSQIESSRSKRQAEACRTTTAECGSSASRGAFAC